MSDDRSSVKERVMKIEIEITPNSFGDACYKVKYDGQLYYQGNNYSSVSQAVNKALKHVQKDFR